MPVCVASGCINSKGVSDNVIFHRFPFHNSSLLAKWISAVGRDNWSPSKQSCICSDHFTPRDYEQLNTDCLKETAVPSQFRKLKKTKTEHLTDKNSENNKTKSRKSIPSNTVTVTVSATRKRGDSLKESEVSPAVKRMKVIQGKKVDMGLKSGKTQSITMSGNSKPVTNSEHKPVSRTENVQQTSLTDNQATSITETSLLTGRRRGLRGRKVLRVSSDESNGEATISSLDYSEVRTTDAEVHLDADEVLAAVRVELDENNLSDEEPDDIFEKWMWHKMERGKATASTNLNRSERNLSEDRQKMPSSAIPADMDHVVAVNERRTRYRYIYRVGQCFPEEDDDVPFIKSKLSFVIKSLQAQNDKLRALQKKCRVLSQSNSMIRDILGIPSTDVKDEFFEPDEQDEQHQAYLIVGSHLSSSASMPSYRFTLTDCSPTTISQSTAN